MKKILAILLLSFLLCENSNAGIKEIGKDNSLLCTIGALEAYNKALKIKQDDEFLFSNLGNLMLEKENYEESIKLYKQGLLINQNSMSCQIGLAAVYAKIQNYEEAYKIYSSLFKNEKINYNVIFGLGFCLLYRYGYKI